MDEKRELRRIPHKGKVVPVLCRPGEYFRIATNRELLDYLLMCKEDYGIDDDGNDIPRPPPPACCERMYEWTHRGRVLTFVCTEALHQSLSRDAWFLDELYWFWTLPLREVMALIEGYRSAKLPVTFDQARYNRLRRRSLGE